MLGSVTQPTLTPSIGMAPTQGATVAAPVAPAIAPSTTPLSSDFSAVLSQMTLDAIGTIKGAEATAVDGVRGKATTQQVVEAMMAAEQTLQPASPFATRSFPPTSKSAVCRSKEPGSQ